MQHRFDQNEIAVQFTSKQNRQFAFRAMSMQVRGDWSVNAVPEKASYGFSNLPDVPGQVAILNPKKRALRVEDPLGWPENKHLLDQINDITDGDMVPAPHKYHACDTSIKRPLNEDDIVTAMWELREHVDGGRARELTAGKLPSREKILAQAREGNKNGKGRLRLRYYVWAGRSLDGTTETPFASDEELDLFGAPAPAKIETIPVG